MGKILIIKGADFSSVAVDKVIAITVVASPSGGGNVTGGGNYDEGTQVTITATPATGYSFQQWSDGDKNATRIITVGSSAKTYTAIFAGVSTKSIERSDLIPTPEYYITVNGDISEGNEITNGQSVDVSSYAGKPIKVVKKEGATFSRVGFLKSAPVINQPADCATGYESKYFETISDAEWNGIIPADAKYMYVMTINTYITGGTDIFPESITVTTQT